MKILIQYTFDTMPLLMCYLSASIVISAYFLIKPLRYVGRAKGINFYSSNGGNIVWGILEKLVGRVSVIFWALSIFNLMINISEDSENGSVLVQPIELLGSIEVVAMSVTGIMAFAAYFLCLITELVKNKVNPTSQP